MYPGYRFVDAFPHQRTPMPPYMHGSYYPTFEASPPEMKMEPCRPPSTYEAWPHGGPFSHPPPVGCHGCCNHSYMPGYTGFRPPYPPHYMQPAPFHGYGAYPMHPETYPMHYMPQPHYFMSQQPRYEYDKPRDHHCCGCANHQSNRKEDRQVKIEEPESDGEKGKDNTSLVPVGFHKDYPYPLMLIPPGYTKNEENKKPSEPELKRQDESKKPSNAEGLWFPLDIKNLGVHGVDGQDVKKTEEGKTLDKNQFPFPIFWMPYKPKGEEGNEKTEALKGSESTKTPPTHSDGSNVQSKSAEDLEGKVMKLKTIPVKQLREHQEKEMKEMDDAAKSTEQSSEKRPSRETSPPKTSKLPPVCLRLEPLKRKSRSVGSRSPSPPGDKEKSARRKEMDKHDMRPSISIIEKTPEEKKPPETTRSDEATNEAGKGISKAAEDQLLSKEAPSPATADVAKESVEAVKSRNMSEEEAALIIQAAFRGFEVRKWEPLKKVKQIAMVKEQVVEVKHRVEAFESSPDVSIDNKQKLLIGETIMSLLLKLDTIQGLHPMVRDIRKSVAKELVSLQEKLDSLATEKPHAPTAKPVDDKDSTPIQEEREAEAAQRNIEDGKSSFQAEPLQGEELHSSPNVEEIKPCNDFEGETLGSPLGQGEEPQSVHEEDGLNTLVHLDLAARDNVDFVAPSTAAVVDQEPSTEESQSNEEVGTCESEVVSPKADEVTSINSETAENRSEPEDCVSVKESEPFDLPSTEEQNVKISEPAEPNLNEASDVTEAQEPQVEGPCMVDEVQDGEASGKEVPVPPLEEPLVELDQHCTMEAPNMVIPQKHGLEEDETTHVGTPQLEESNIELEPEVPLEENGSMEPPKSGIPQEERGINGKDESFEDKEVLIEDSETESHVEKAEEVSIQASEQYDTELTGEENKEQPLQEQTKDSANENYQKLETAEENALEKADSDQRLLEENQRLKKMIQELIEAGKDQLSAITDLSGKVKHLERKLARKKKVKARRTKSAKERIEDIAV